MNLRYSSGIPQLDQMLGGGYLPGSMTMVVGATGVGKTQLGMSFIHQGIAADGCRGAIVDLSSRGDSQNHLGYYQRLFDQRLRIDGPEQISERGLLSEERPADVLSFLGYSGRRVMRSQMDADQWHSWQSEMNRRTPQLFRYVYNHLTSGTRRFVVDGIEPTESADDSLQLDLVELFYHRMLRQEHDWLAREVLRESFRANEHHVAKRAYNHEHTSAMVLVTTSESMLDRLILQPLASGDLAAGANTIILLGRRLVNDRMERALFVAKHRGSYCDQRIVSFDIDDRGLKFS
jgi:KaiC/GvpD/RAD55 family RecA-like ATPase